MEIKLPNNWDEVLSDQFIELKKLDDVESSFFIKQIEVLSILTDTLPDDEVWEDLDVEVLSKYIKDISWLKQEPSKDFKNKIGDLTCIDINELKFGEFIDLEYYFSTNNYFENLFNICSIFYRQTKTNEWGKIIIEPYENVNIKERSEVFKELPITNIYGIIHYYKEYKENILKTYEKLFEPQFEEVEEDTSGYNPEDISDIQEEKVMIKWGWENVIFKLSKGDITKYDKITELPLIMVLNHLSHIRDMKLEV